MTRQTKRQAGRRTAKRPVVWAAPNSLALVHIPLYSLRWWWLDTRKRNGLAARPVESKARGWNKGLALVACVARPSTHCWAVGRSFDQAGPKVKMRSGPPPRYCLSSCALRRWGEGEKKERKKGQALPCPGLADFVLLGRKPSSGLE